MPLQAEPDQQPPQTLSVRPKQPQQKGGGGGERVLPAKSSWRPIPTRSHLKLSLFVQNNPNKRLTISFFLFFFFFFKVLLVTSPWRPIRTRNHLKFSQIAQNNPNTKQTKKPSVTGKIALEADPDEKPPQTPSDRPKQPQQKANKPTTKMYYCRNPPGGGARRGTTSNSVCSPKTTTTKSKLTRKT